MNAVEHRSLRGNLSVADIRTIMVPIDCGARSIALLRSAAALARCVGAHLVILHVYKPLTFAPSHCSAEQYEMWQEGRRHTAEQKLRELRGTFPDDPVVQAAALVAAGGFPEEVICSVARTMSVDLIVASTHGYSGIGRLFLGSKAGKLIGCVPCPILILPPVVEGADDERGVIGLHWRCEEEAAPREPESRVEESPHAIPLS